MCSVSWAQILQVRCGHQDHTHWHWSPFTNPAETTNAFLRLHCALSSLLIIQQAVTHWYLQGWASQICWNDRSYRKEADAQKGKEKAGACQGSSVSLGTELLQRNTNTSSRERYMLKKHLLAGTERQQECYSSLQCMSLMLKNLTLQQHFIWWKPWSNLHFLKGISKVIVKISLSNSQNHTVSPWQIIFSICENPLFNFQQSLYLKISL